LPSASLTKRFLFTLVLSAAVPLVAFSWFALVGMRDRMERRIGDVYLPQLASDAAVNVAARVDYIRRTLALLVTPAANLLAEPGRRREFEDQAKLLPDVNEFFDLILLLGAEGRVVHALYNPRLDPTTRAARQALRPERVRQDDTPWYAEIVRGASEVWVDRHLSPFLHRSSERSSRDPAEHHVGLALQVAGSTPGCLFALARWERVQEVVDNAVAFLRDPARASLPSAEGFVVDPRGVALAHTQRGAYGEPLQPDMLRQRVLSAARGPLAFIDGEGQPRRGGSARIEGLPPGLAWWFGLHVRESELFATSRDFARLLMAAIAGLVLVLGLWSLIASRAITAPVRDLAEATRRLAAGDLDARVATTGPAELGELSRSFNQMAEDLARSRLQLRAAERQAAWAEMARQVAHEIKNPLTPMRMSAQLLQRARRDGDARAPELAERLAKTVLDQTDALAKIAADFRQFAGPPQRQRERVAVAALFGDVAAFFADLAQVRGITLRVHEVAPGLAVAGDPKELARVLINLVQNAIEADGKRVDVAATAEDGAVVLTVTDDGPGVPADMHDKLFDPYFTTKSSGTGLGLAICRRIVEAHGGEIALRGSRVGETVFVVRLPRVS
jgi:signal transduction histidine kinase